MVSFLKNCSTNGVWKTRTKSPHSSGIEPPAACTAARGLRMILAPNNPRASAPWAPPDRNEQAADHCGKTLGSSRHRSCDRRLHQGKRLLRVGALCAFVGGRPSARTERAGRVRGQAWEVVVC